MNVRTCEAGITIEMYDGWKVGDLLRALAASADKREAAGDHLVDVVPQYQPYGGGWELLGIWETSELPAGPVPDQSELDEVTGTPV